MDSAGPPRDNRRKSIRMEATKMPNSSINRRNALLASVGAVAATVVVSKVSAETAAQPKTQAQVREERAYAAGIQVALWGRPLVDNVHTLAAALKAGAVGLNYFRKFPNLKTAADRFVNTPNNVSIDGYAAAELATEPVVVTVPSVSEKRWYIVQIGDYYDQVVYNIGGSKGPEPGLFLITGPDYQGAIPAGMKQIRVRTQLAVVANRVFVSGEPDLPGAREVQQGTSLLPLSVFLKQGLRFEVPKQYDYERYVFTPTAPEPLRVFDTIGFGMKTFLSRSDDFTDPDVGAAQQIGLSVARGFDWKNLDEPTKQGLARAAVTAQAIIEDTYANAAEIVNGWRYTMGGGRASFNYAMRAAFSANLTGANVPEEILYPNTRVDDKGAPLSGANKYVLHFDKDKMPPVSVFWNMSMYDEKEFFIENDFKRYSIGSTTDGLKTSPDGSITILIQNERPQDTSNWLPAPTGSFNLTMRLYGSQTPILDGSYRLPGIRRVN
jgi:hypothetical protein